MLRQSSVSRRDFLLRGSIALTCGAALGRYPARLKQQPKSMSKLRRPTAAFGG